MFGLLADVLALLPQSFSLVYLLPSIIELLLGREFRNKFY